MTFTAKKIQINQNQVMTYHIDKGHANTLLLIHGGPGSTSLSLRETHGFFIASTASTFSLGIS
ncbi:MAG: hypothetical protein NTV32_06545 [Gammaproteobacteria bacterium]|nr:hypothetical protein [Gammaproteobacteria bacterium]